MSLKTAVRWVVPGIVFIALIEALHVMIPVVWGAFIEALHAMIPTINESGEVLNYKLKIAVILAFLYTFIGWRVIDQRVGTELMDGDEREYVEAAWLAGLSGLLLMVIEAVFEFGCLKSFEVEFIFEDLLLGVSALCMLAEEVRLLRAAMKAAGILQVGPGFDRIVTPPPQGS